MHTFAIALRNRFRGIDVREGVLIQGEAGWGEFSPFWDYSAAECRPWLRAATEAAEVGFPAPRRHSIAVNVTIPTVSAAVAERLVRDSAGCRTAKVKVAEPGEDLAREADRLAAVRAALGPTGHVRIDANGGWDVATAIERITVLHRIADLEYVEQPCRTVAELAEVRRRVPVPIAADESIRRAEDPFAVRAADAADIVVLKVQPLGGVRACLTLAEQIGLPVVVSSAVESSVGIAAGVALAAALPDLPYACGLATGQLLTADVTADPLRVVDGCLPVRAVKELGEIPGEGDPELRRRWDERLAAVRAAR